MQDNDKISALRPNGTLDRTLRVVFLCLLGIGLVTGYVMKPSLNKDMRQFLKGSYVESIEQYEPSIALPFLPWGGRILTVWHRYEIPGDDRQLLLRSFFSRKGEYRATRTDQLPTLKRRRSAGDLEVALMRAGEHYFEPDASFQSLQFSTIINQLSQRIDTSRIQGFILFPVRYAKNENISSKEAEPAVVMHLWCEQPKSELTKLTAKPCPPATRIVYSLTSNTIVKHDDLL